MAREFVPADNDKITTSFSAHATTRTYSLWAFTDAGGGGDRARYFEKRVTGVQAEVLIYNTSVDANTPFLEYNRNWAGTARWRVPTNSPTLGQWVHIVVTYDAGSTANDPVIYLDGTSQTITEIAAPSGTLVTNTDAYVLGARGNATDRNFDGKLAEFAIWDRILSAGEIASLADGFSPAFFLSSLVCYTPLVRSMVDYKNAAATDTGTGEFAHPRIFYPSSSQVRRFTTAAAAAAAQGAWKSLLGAGL